MKRSAKRGGVFVWFRDWDDFQIDGIRQDVPGSLKSAVRYSIALGPRCFRWKMLSLSGPKARVLMQLLILLVTWSVVNVTVEVNEFHLISLYINRTPGKKCVCPDLKWWTVSCNSWRSALGKTLENSKI